VASIGEIETINDDYHIRTQLLVQYKYDTEKSKSFTFMIITLLSIVFTFPILILHFYRTYNNDLSSSDFDNPKLISHRVYTGFAWLSYLTLIIKSFICLVLNKFYRDAFYQAANCRGFDGLFDYERDGKLEDKEDDDVT
jgi:hypothetical protein